MLAKSGLFVPDQHVQEVVDTIKAGMVVMKNMISIDTQANLSRWCAEQEAYLKEVKECGNGEIW